MAGGIAFSDFKGHETSTISGGESKYLKTNRRSIYAFDFAC